MKLAIIISTADAETNWNAFRLANLALEQNDEVKVFLIGKGVEYEKSASEKFNINEQVEKFLGFAKAGILACRTCLEIRRQKETKTCPMNSINDLYSLIKESDKIINF